MTIQQAKEIDIVDYLSQQGHQPAKISGQNYWYHSPLHVEKNPSFKVNRKMNRWYDFSEGRGGNLVDFGISYHQCSINDFLDKVAVYSGYIPSQKVSVQLNSNADNDKRILVLSVAPISSVALKSYLRIRKITRDVASKYCNEITFSIGEKSYYAIGFKNNAGGYELRNQNMKVSSSPKDVSFIENNAKKLIVFEGFFNFLSYQTLYHKQDQEPANFLVLNSASFFEKNLFKMQSYERVFLYLDNDKTGQKITALAQARDKEKFLDQRHLYSNHKDLNDWLVNRGQIQRLRI
ncbi:MAG: toprim domain-containing protein [Bacteroidota bacterium]